MDAATALRHLERSATRYLEASERDEGAEHLPVMLQVATGWTQEAFRRGATLAEVADAIGIVLPPPRITADKIVVGTVEWDALVVHEGIPTYHYAVTRDGRVIERPTPEELETLR